MNSPLDEAAATRHPRRLGAAYPAFSFNYATLGRKGRRTVCEKIAAVLRSVEGRS